MAFFVHTSTMTGHHLVINSVLDSIAATFPADKRGLEAAKRFAEDKNARNSVRG